MAQFIDIAYKSQISSGKINEKVVEMLGKNGILKGFSVAPGINLSVNVSLGADDSSVLFINGARIKETSSINGISIAENSSGIVRTDTLYAYYEHGTTPTCQYLIAAGSTQPPTPALSCKIAEIDVPSGATSISADNIRMEPKIYSLSRLSEKATANKDGLMSKEYVDKLDNIADNANNYTHPTTSGNKHIPAGGVAGKILGWASDGTATWIDTPVSYTHPTTSGNKHIPAGGVAGKILGWASDGTAAWIDAPVTYTHPTTAGNKHIPSGGATGQVLTYGGSSGTATWAAIPNQNTAMDQSSAAAKLKATAILQKYVSTTLYTIVDANAKVWRAVYNDLAELMIKGQDGLEPGDVLVQSEDGLVKTGIYADGKVVGVYSDTFGFCLGGDELESIEANENMVPVGISGKVLVKVRGNVKIGDLLVTSDIPGYAEAIDKRNLIPGTVFAKAIENYDESIDRNKRIWALIMNC